MSDAERLDLLLHNFLSRFFSIPARQPASGSITFAQMRVLWTLDQVPSATPGEVAQQLGISNSTSTGLVERLAEAKYLTRVHSTEDRRRVVLRLTSKGRRMMGAFRRLRQSRLNRLVSTLGSSDVRRMTNALETLNGIVGRWRRA